MSVLDEMLTALTAIENNTNTTNSLLLTSNEIAIINRDTLIDILHNTTDLLTNSNALLSVVEVIDATLSGEVLTALGELVTNTGMTNDKIQLYLGDVEGTPSTVSLQDQLNAINLNLHDEGTDQPYLLSIETTNDIIADHITDWNLGGTCKVTVDDVVTVEGTVSVEPGLVPLDVIVLP